MTQLARRVMGVGVRATRRAIDRLEPSRLATGASPARGRVARLVLAAIAAVPCALLLLPVALIACALTLFATAVQALARRFESAYVPWADLMTFDAELGWRPRPNVNVHYLADNDDVFSLVTDAEGWPGVASLDESDVVVIGDSFAFGYGVDAGRSFASYEKELSVKGVGAPGYSMVHGVLLMRTLGARLWGKVVVWFVYLENDLQDNLVPEMRGYRAPFARFDPVSKRWGIAQQHITSERWRCSNQDPRRLFPRLCVPGPLADRAYDACDYLIGEAAAACRTHGARLVVVTIPHPLQMTPRGLETLAARSGDAAACDATFPDRRLAAACARVAVPMVAGLSRLSARHYKRREGIHWNERGHRAMAGVVRDAVTVATAALPTIRGTRPLTLVPRAADPSR